MKPSIKLSVSVPDDLWSSVRVENEPASHIVQRALQLLKAQSDRPFANAPEGVDLSRANQIAEQVVVKAEDSRREGYELGLWFAEHIASYDKFEGFLERHDFNLRTVAAHLGKIYRRWVGPEIRTHPEISRPDTELEATRIYSDSEYADDFEFNMFVTMFDDKFDLGSAEGIVPPWNIDNGTIYLGVAQAFVDVHKAVFHRLLKNTTRVDHPPTSEKPKIDNTKEEEK